MSSLPRIIRKRFYRVNKRIRVLKLAGTIRKPRRLRVRRHSTLGTILNLKRTPTTKSAVRAVGVGGVTIDMRAVLVTTRAVDVPVRPPNVLSVGMAIAVVMRSIAVVGGNILVITGIVRNALFSISL